MDTPLGETAWMVGFSSTSIIFHRGAQGHQVSQAAEYNKSF